jgi:hypothetical protein
MWSFPSLKIESSLFILVIAETIIWLVLIWQKYGNIFSIFLLNRHRLKHILKDVIDDLKYFFVDRRNDKSL